ncbi:hypothetical protein EON65_09740 [archaeon]|nr:MAG: hypothetical protein EON65_09740 [archaeon]
MLYARIRLLFVYILFTTSTNYSTNPPPPSCSIAIKVEKKEGESVDYTKMKIKELKQLLKERDVSCVGCTEKADYVKKAQESEL